jgi:phytoene dehydrogenase-like protein
VYGAGVAGMATALRLRNQGFDVTVMERTGSYGYPLGSAHHFGYRFELGPSMITLPAVYRDLFIKTGAPLEEVVDLQAVDVAREFVFSDGTRITTPGVGLPAFASAIAESLGESAAQEWRSIIIQAANHWSAIRQELLQSRPLSLRAVVSSLRSNGVLGLYVGVRSAASRLRQIRNDQLRQIADYLLRTHSLLPMRVNEHAFMLAYIEQEFGLWHINGGSSALADAIYQRCVDRGVSFEFDVDVSARAQTRSDVLVYESRLESVLLDEACLDAAVICVLLDQRVDLNAHETVYLPDHASATGIGAIAVSYAASETDVESRVQALRIAVPLPLSSTDEDRELYAGKVLDELAHRGFDIRDHVAGAHSYAAAETPNQAHTVHRLYYELQNNRRSLDRGQYTVGGNAYPGGRAEFSLMGAEIVADLVRADFPKSQSK